LGIVVPSIFRAATESYDEQYWSELDSQLTKTNEQLEKSKQSTAEFDRQHAELVRQREAHGIFQSDIARQYEEYKRCQAEEKQAKK
jgi:ABC-type Fe2+-enterobactin transport system substrate-binding protein